MIIRKIIAVGGGAMGIWDASIAEVIKHPDTEKKQPN